MSTAPGEPPSGVSRGCLFLVVGPSGAGKDTLIEGLRERLLDRPDVVFPRRFITRPPDAGGEAHVAVSEAGFAALCRAGALCLHWRSHGLHYGVPLSMAAQLAAGRAAVVNVSRSVVDEARARLAPLRVLSLRVSPEVLRARLRTRGREGGEAIEARLARAEAFGVCGADVTVLDNDGPPHEAIERVLALLLASLPAGPRIG